MRKINTIIIHCADTPNGKYFDAKDIDDWHRDKGWRGIGYHNVICTDGEVQRGRSYDIKGAHARGFNDSSIGICLIGRDKFTSEQWSSLFALVDRLKATYDIKMIIGHNDVDEHKTCPNFNVADWLAYGPDTRNMLEV